VLLLVAWGPTAEAQHFGRNKVVYDDFDFQHIQTEHFDVYYYPPMEPAAQDAARMAERWYGRLSRVFQHIIFYADDTDFQQTNVIGSRTAVASAEVRLPVLGVRELGLVPFPYLPTDLVAFADGGVAWSSDEAPTFEFERDSNERIPVFSTGLGARVNVLGALVLELSYAYPFQRPDEGWHFDVQVSPGW
jgi:hypothetical protein